MTSNRLPALGDRVRDKITGFEGVVVSHSRHIAGCDRLWVQPRVREDNKPAEGQWMDIDMVEIIQPGQVEPVVYERRAPGGVDLPAPR